MKLENNQFSLKFTEVINNHFKYQCTINNNNNIQMQPISIEWTWETKKWEHHPYVFFLGVLHANAQRGFEILGEHQKEPTLKFCKKLAKELIYNKYIPGRGNEEDRNIRDKKKQKAMICKLISLPKFLQFPCTKIVSFPAPYNQWKCICGKTEARTYCICTPGFIRCNLYFVDHCLHNENV